MTDLDERTKKVLWSIIQCYIDRNAPVSSFMVKKRFSFGLSPATIRNTMADLESSGFITQPHTSAGRIPTDKAYRLYVDGLLRQNSRSVNTILLRKLYDRLRGMQRDLKTLISETSRTLSFFSSCVGIVTPPKAEEEVLRSIRFINHEKNRALSIMIFENGTVKNRMIDLHSSFSMNQLTKIARYLNDTFAGMSLKEIRQEIVSQLSRQKMACNLLITNALKICEEMIIWQSDDLLGDGLTGTSNLPDFTDIGQIKNILKTIEDKHMILKLLNEVDDTKGVQVFVGLESIIPSMKTLSMVVSPYAYRKRTSGTIGIIGPTRMNYEQLIPIVDHTARALTKVLSET
jgi:heat-inducible transcriptional repressor